MSLRLDVYMKRKVVDRRSAQKFIDKRKFRQQMSYEENLFEKLKYYLNYFGVSDIERVALELKKVKNFENLNFSLLIVVYIYFSSKNFNLGNVVRNFDKDFKEQVEKIKNSDAFDNIEKLDKKNILYNFRQDFIVYLILINDIDEDSYSEKNIEDNISEDNNIMRETDINYDRYESMHDNDNEYSDDEYYQDLEY